MADKPKLSSAERETGAQLAALLAVLAPSPADAAGSIGALAAYVLTAAREPMAMVAYEPLVEACAAVDELAREALGCSLNQANAGELEELLTACATEAPDSWRPFFGALTVMALEGLLYGGRPESGAVWRAIGHPWAAPDTGSTGAVVSGESEPS